MLTGYAFSNMHDCSWGTKGLHLNDNKQGLITDRTYKTFNSFRTCMLFAWLITNSLLIVYIITSNSNSATSIENTFIGILIGFVGFKTLSGLLFVFFRYSQWSPKRAIGKMKQGVVKMTFRIFGGKMKKK
jgi:hypothetical protein